MLLRQVKEKIKIKTLFTRLNIPDKEHATLNPVFNIKVKTPYGYYDIKQLFRTELQDSVTLYFGNNKTLKTSFRHRLKCNDEWKFVDEITETDIIETETGLTYLKSKHVGKKEILYDISVDKVNCYYSNGILSHNSWGLINIGGTAVKAGKTVFHFTLENYQNYTGQRYDAFLSGIPFENLRFNIEDVQAAVTKLTGKLYIEYAPSGTLSINMIKAYLDKAALDGIKPDLIIVDYADLMRSSIKNSKAELRHMLNNIYVELRGVAGIYNVPIWTASQANRSAANSDIIQGDQVSEDYSKIMTADLVISLQRKLTDKLSGTGSWHFIKNRFGPDGLTFPSKIAFGTGFIQIFEPNSLQGKETTQIQKNGEDVIRKTALSRYKEMKDNAPTKKLTKFN